MLTKPQITDIREHLDNAQNPLFFFDNDPDGLCSFILLQRYIQRGKGFPVKSAPLNKDYFRKIQEFNPDYIFILDIPTVSGEFFEEIKKINLPVVWIDHHNMEKNKVPDFVNYYNPLLGKDFPSSTTYLCYEVVKKKEDLWLTITGSIADNFVPEVYEEFKKFYPDLFIDSTNAFEILYNSRIGVVAHLLNCGLKDKTTNVIKMIKFLMKVKSPYEILEKTSENKEMHEKYQIINKKLKKFLEEAQEQAKASDKLIFFEYGGDTSMSAEISNSLKYLFPGKIIFVVYASESNSFANVSGRGENVKDILDRVLQQGNFENASGGGHENAVGARIMKKDLEKFREILKEDVGESRA
ncbi:MAG: DHH family phosphoesterase [Nanoarchaeota archaeon]